MRIPFTALVLLAGCSAAPPRPVPPRGEVVLTVRGEVENGPFTFGSGDLADLPRRSFRARDPRFQKETQVEGIALAPLLTQRMTPKDGADTAVFRSKNGYDVAIPLQAVKRHQPLLADRTDGFGLQLTWPNVDEPGIDTDPRTVPWWWADQVIAIELVQWSKTYGRALRVPAGAGDAARVGATRFATNCIHCHRVRGVGGSSGPELTETLQAWDLDRFHSYMRNHGGTRAAGVIPPQATIGRESIGQTGIFLKAVAAARPSAADDPPDEPEPPPRGDRAPRRDRGWDKTRG
jgi:hypothetical protein